MRFSPLIDRTPTALLQRVAGRARARRVAMGLTRAVAASRSGMSVESLRKFEVSGRIAFDRLIRLAVVLEAEDAIDTLFPGYVLESLADLDRVDQRRVRGVRRDAGQKRTARAKAH